MLRNNQRLHVTLCAGLTNDSEAGVGAGVAAPISPAPELAVCASRLRIAGPAAASCCGQVQKLQHAMQALPQGRSVTSCPRPGKARGTCWWTWSMLCKRRLRVALQFKVGLRDEWQVSKNQDLGRQSKGRRRNKSSRWTTHGSSAYDRVTCARD